MSTEQPTRAPSPDDVWQVPGSVELVRMEPPLVEFLRTWLQQSLVAHITGGMQIEGRLEAVNDDFTITMRDGPQRYEVAISSIAFVQVRG